MFHENRVWQGCLKSLVIFCGLALFCALSTAAQPMVELTM